MENAIPSSEVKSFQVHGARELLTYSLRRMARLSITLLLLLSATTPHASAWSGSLVLAWIGPQPLRPDTDADFSPGLKNAGSQPLRVDSVAVQFDWMPQAMNLQDLPKVLPSGDSYSWRIKVHVPKAAGNESRHSVRVTVYASEPSGSGGWTPDQQPAVFEFSWPVSSNPLALAYSVEWTLLYPIFGGHTLEFKTSTRNEGQFPFRVSRLQVLSDWRAVSTWEPADNSTVIEPLATQDFELTIGIPISIAGQHELRVKMWVATSTGQGSGSGETEVDIGTITLQIQPSPTRQMTCDQANCYIVSEGSTVSTLTKAESRTDSSTPAIIASVVALLLIASFASSWLRRSRKASQFLISNAANILPLMLALSGVMGVVILVTDKILWDEAPFGHLYGLIAFTALDFTVGGYLVIKKSNLALKTAAAWSIVRLIIQFADIFTGPLTGLTYSEFANYLFNPIADNPPNPTGVPGVPIDIITFSDLIVALVAWNFLKAKRDLSLGP